MVPDYTTMDFGIGSSCGTSAIPSYTWFRFHLFADKYWKRRQEIWTRYNEAFKDLPVFTPAPIEHGTRHAYHLYTLLLDIDNLNLNITRDKFLDEMTKRNIQYLCLFQQS
jgi:dTDP-4-amino-4,6-dideoxygalactose transaminase